MTDIPLETPSTDPTPEPQPPTGRPLAELLNELESPEMAIRLAAAQQLGRLEQSDIQALRALEKRVAQDESAEVCEAALLALAARPYRLLQQQANRAQPVLRQAILAEIERWRAEGLLPEQTARLLRQRYDFQLQTTSAPVATSTPAGPRPSLGQILLSETTIQVALYLGAFFVVAAAFILAALFEILRLPILGLATVGF